VHIVGDIPDDLPGLVPQEWDPTREIQENQEDRDAFRPLLSGDLDEDSVLIAAESFPEPDYMDYVNGMVNTTRGEVRTRGSRRNASNSSSDDASSLLGAYLAAASLSNLVNTDDDDGDTGLQGLGRLLRQRETNGGNGGGIDIHIHAIVTGPGVGNGGGGMTIIGSETGGSGASGGGGGGGGGGALTGTASRPSPFSIGSRSTPISPESPRIAQPETTDEDDLGIFADLYSDNPSPIDLQNGIGPVDGAEVASARVASLPIDLGTEDQEEDFISRLNASRSSAALSVSSTEVMSPTRPPRSTQSVSSVTSASSGGRRGNPMSRLIRRISSRRGSAN